jgi:ornithine cyclodeaminase/alanine dehydrogenase-like protein (mu-crystallin family)
LSPIGKIFSDGLTAVDTSNCWTHSSSNEMALTHLSETEVRRLLDPLEVISAIEAGFRDRYPTVTIPTRTQAQVADGIFLGMMCFDQSTRTMGMKLVLVRERSREVTGARAATDAALLAGRIQATYLLLDHETAQPMLSMSANYLTDLRTAATSAVATKFLARADARTLGIFGTGRLARTHLKALTLVRDFQRVLICGRNPSRSSEFVDETAREFPGLSIVPADARTCASDSDVICTCTSGSKPLFDGEDLRDGTHLNLVGCFQPHAREVDSITIQRSRVFVDTYDAVSSEMGDLLIPISEGRIKPNHVSGDLHELVCGKKAGRRTEREVTVFKSVGVSLEDLIAAEIVLKRRRAQEQ